MATELPSYEKLGVFYLGRVHDGASHQTTAQPLLYDSQDLLTHGVCVGMTGSGKTGLCIALLEEAALDGIPALIIDPKGDLANLLLTFPALRPEDFRPWIDEAEAQRQGQSADDFAAAQATLWRKGLASWEEDGARIQRFCDAADVAVYTPGSEAGLPLSILASLRAPGEAVLNDADLLADRIQTVAGSLLSLLGIEADPVRSREHVLLANILADRFRAGADLDLASLIQLIQEPPMKRIGVMDLESFYPAKDRFGLALALNNLLASPTMQSWLVGEPLDIDRLLYTAEGKPRLAILSIAHLSDNERMFFVSLLLSEVVGWMRSRSGTSSLRALLYMDEVFGFLPPLGEPPSKKPLLTLFKQARAFGVGVLLATQNPADLDYKALSNAGTWFLGRLQTERDKMRVLEGLEGAAAAASSGFDRGAMEQVLAGLGKRIFLLHNVHEKEPLLFESRWALSYLRGPMTRQEIKRLTDGRRASQAPESGAAARPAASPLATTAATGSRPVLPPEVQQAFLAARGGGAVVYHPGVLGLATVHYDDAKKGIQATEEVAVLAPLHGGGGGLDWRQAADLGAAGFDAERDLDAAPLGDATFAEADGLGGVAKAAKSWEKDLADALYRDRKLELWSAKDLGEVSQPGEDERSFRVRIAERAREARDAEKEKLRQRYASKVQALEDRIRRAEERVAREEAQARQARTSSWLSVGATAVSALFGRKTLSRSTISKASSAIKGFSRSSEESQDVERAAQEVEVQKQNLADLAAQIESELAALGARLDPQAQPLETVVIRPKKSDVAIRRVVLAWAPYRDDRPAWQ